MELASIGFLKVLCYSGLALSAVAPVVLLYLLFKDWKSGSIW